MADALNMDRIASQPAEGDAPEPAPSPGGRPPEMPEAFWDAEHNVPRKDTAKFWDPENKRVRVDALYKAFADTRADWEKMRGQKGELPASPGDYEVRLPDDLKDAIGEDQWKELAGDPAVQGLSEIFHRRGVGQDVMDDVLAMVFRLHASQVTAGREAEAAAAEERVSQTTEMLKSFGITSEETLDAISRHLDAQVSKRVMSPELRTQISELCKREPMVAVVLNHYRTLSAEKPLPGAQPPVVETPKSIQQKAMERLNDPRAIPGNPKYDREWVKENVESLYR